MTTPTREELQAAKDRCDREWEAAGSKAPCFDERYMAARRDYHALMVAAGLLDPALSDAHRPNPTG